MKNFLFILNDYEPFTSANTICMQKYINEIIRRGHNVDIITTKNSLEIDNFQKINSVNVYRFNNWYITLIKSLNTIKSENLPKILKCFFIPCFYLFKLIGYLYDKKNIESLYCEIDINSIIKKVISLNEIRSYDSVIAVSFPFAMQNIGSRIKSELIERGSKIKFIAYEFDPFTDNYTLPKRKLKKRYKIEKKVFENADLIVITPEMNESGTIEYFKEFSKKTLVLPLPNLINKVWNKHTTVEVEKNNSIVECVYTGSLYESIRNPEFMLKFFSKDEFSNYKIHIYGLGCEKILQKYKEIMKDRLILHGYVSPDVAEKALLDSDFMLNIGNTISNQTPSKIFEMISMGKPIINFYSIDNDSSLKYVKKNPVVFNLNINDNLEQNISKVILFANENIGKQLDFNEATKNIANCKSEAVIDVFLSYLNV